MSMIEKVQKVLEDWHYKTISTQDMKDMTQRICQLFPKTPDGYDPSADEICAYCGKPADAAMLKMGNSMAHDTCVIRKLNELLDPDYFGKGEPDEIVKKIQPADESIVSATKLKNIEKVKDIIRSFGLHSGLCYSEEISERTINNLTEKIFEVLSDVDISKRELIEYGNKVASRTASIVKAKEQELEK